METIKFKTDNIDLLYSKYNGTIKNIKITINIKIEDTEYPNRFRHALFRKAERFFINNNPHELSYVSIISPSNKENYSTYDFWNKNQDNIYTSYEIIIELDVLCEITSLGSNKPNVYNLGELTKVYNYKELMMNDLNECNNKKDERVRELEDNFKEIMFNYLDNNNIKNIKDDYMAYYINYL